MNPTQKLELLNAVLALGRDWQTSPSTPGDADTVGAPYVPECPQAIVVAERGWVFVGKVRREGMDLVIENARCIRRWGTTDGLGQLALRGPAAETVLDDMGVVVVPGRAVIALIPCKATW